MGGEGQPGRSWVNAVSCFSNNSMFTKLKMWSGLTYFICVYVFPVHFLLIFKTIRNVRDI